MKSYLTLLVIIFLSGSVVAELEIIGDSTGDPVINLQTKSASCTTCIGNGTFNQTLTDQIYVNIDGDNMTGDLNMTANDIHNVGDISIRQFIMGIFGGGIDLSGDPWFFSGADLEIDQDLAVDGNIISNLTPNPTLTRDLGSGANRWRWLYVQNISAEEMDAYNLHLSYNLTIDGLINGVNISNLSNAVPMTNIFNQSLNTTDNVTFTQLNVTSGIFYGANKEFISVGVPNGDIKFTGNGSSYNSSLIIDTDDYFGPVIKSSGAIAGLYNPVTFYDHIAIRDTDRTDGGLLLAGKSYDLNTATTGQQALIVSPTITTYGAQALNALSFTISATPTLSKNTGEIRGLLGYLYVLGNGNMSYAEGAYFGVLHYSNATIDNAWGVFGQIQNTFAAKSQKQLIKEAKVFYADSVKAEVGNVTNAYSFYSSAHVGNVTNAYGAYLSRQSSGLNSSYQIFSEGGTNFWGRTNESYIDGSRIIGNVTFMGNITIIGNLNVTGCIDYNGGKVGTCV